MKEQINRYARGAFEYEPLSAVTEPQSINDVVWKNKEYSGSLRISELHGREIKGLIYSSNNRVQLKLDRFMGERAVIAYNVDADTIEPGDRITGCFRIVSSGGELEIPYEFEVASGGYISENEEIRNLFQFASLAQNDSARALRIFASKDFNDVFLKGDLSLLKLKDELMTGGDIRTALEEFLIAIHKKSPVHISLSEEEMNIPYPETDTVAGVVISKNVWGRLILNIETDGDFIEVSKKNLTEENFTGGKLEFRFSIIRSKIHAGKNIGRIVFSTPFEKKVLIIRIDNISENEGKVFNMFEKRSVVALMRAYMDFRLHRIGLNDWLERSKGALGELLKRDEDNPYCCLLMSQLLITEKKMNEAKYYLDCAKDEAVSGQNSRQMLYCYYLYVSTLYNRDRTYALETAQTVKDIYERGNSDWRILWILLYLDVEMSKNKSLKLLRIKEQFNKGMRSPVMFLEACLILNEQPLLLRVLNEFEIHVLLFGCKEGIIEDKLLRQAAGLAYNSECRQRLLYRLLTRMYDISQNDDVLEAVCGILIRNGMKGEKYLKWYERGIRKDIRVTKLYEYYLASRRRDDLSPLPKMVLLYFGYNNELNRELRAYLYANLIRNREDYQQIYASYSVQMDEFVRDELRRGTADENTGIIFKEYLKKDMIDEKNAVTAAETFFTYKLECSEPGIKGVIVGHKELDCFELYTLTDGEAYVKIYTEEPCICFIDGYKNVYKDTIGYKLEKVYSNDVLIKPLMPYCEDELMPSLYFCERSRAYKDNSLDTIRLYGKTARRKEIIPAYKRQLVALIIDYYFDNYEGEDLDRLLDAQQEDGLFVPDELLESQLVKYIEALIIHGKYDDAYKLIHRVRHERLNPKRVLKLCDYIIKRAAESEELFEPEASLVSLAYYAFSKGKYSEYTLRLLNIHFNGGTEEMHKLWKASVEQGIDVYELEERLTGQMLFCRCSCADMEDVFAHYIRNGAGERMIEAYLAYNSYMYFVKGETVPQEVFSFIEDRIQADKDVILVCRLALIRSYSESDILSEEKAAAAQRLIEALSRKGYVFSCFSCFSRYFPLPYRIVDKTVVEYKADPEHRVVIHYAMGKEEEYTAMDMKNMYEGVFVKSFVLFYGDRVRYYITEEADGTEKTSEEYSIEYTSADGDIATGRYELLNRIMEDEAVGDNDSLNSHMDLYSMQNEAVRLFKTAL